MICSSVSVSCSISAASELRNWTERRALVLLGCALGEVRSRRRAGAVIAQIDRELIGHRLHRKLSSVAGGGQRRALAQAYPREIAANHAARGPAP